MKPVMQQSEIETLQSRLKTATDALREMQSCLSEDLFEPYYDHAKETNYLWCIGCGEKSENLVDKPDCKDTCPRINLITIANKAIKEVEGGD